MSSLLPAPASEVKLHRALTSSSFVSSMVPTDLMIEYFVRVDKGGFFHTYPDRGGPFQTLEEAQEAIDSHHAVQRENICMDGLSDEERAVRNTLYWYHDGTRRHSAEAYASVTTYNPRWELLKALLDRHNEDNDLLGDGAYELEDIVRANDCFDGDDCIYRSYSHFNLTMKTKGADDANKDLYFAKVTCTSEDYEAYVLTCICVVKPDHNGECLVCEVEMEDMKHPTGDGYNHGRHPKFHVRSSPSRRARVRAYGVDLFEKLYGVRDEAWLIAEEATVRRRIKEKMDAKLEVANRGDGGVIEEGRDNARSSDEILKGARVRTRVGTVLKEATMRSKLDFKEDSWDGLLAHKVKDMVARRKLDLKVAFWDESALNDLEARRKLDLKVGFWDELALKDLEARRELEVDKKGGVDDNTVEKEKDAWYSKLEEDDERGIKY